MHRCCSGFLLTLAIIFAVAFTGCLGKSSNISGNGAVTSVSISPGNSISIDVGSTQIFSASGKYADGHAVIGVDIQFLVVSGNPNSAAPISITSGGNACAGTWDPTGTMCSPGTPGIAEVSAVINGVSSTPTTVYVHQHIDSLQVSRLDPQGPPQYDCFSQGQTWNYQATAYSQIGSNSVDITSTVGPMFWLSKNTGVVTTASIVPPNQPNVLNQVQVTAKTPGITELFANVSGATSSGYAFTTCLIQAIWLQIGGQGQQGSSITVNNGGSVPVSAVAVDTLCGTANNTPLSALPLTWSTTNPEVIAFANTASTTASNSAAARNNYGGGTIFASCTPPTCNIGVLPGLPIYSSDYPPTPPPASPPTKCQPPNMTKGFGTISVDVVPGPNAKPVTYSAWAATTGCGNAIGCTSALFAVTPGTTPIGTIVSLPRTPNSMMFNHLAAARVYIGSDQGLMYVDVGASTPSAAVVSSSTTCNVALCGKVLTISNDGKLAVVSDTVSTPSQVYIYNGGSSSAASIDLILSNTGETATAAAFSPDQAKIFILTNLGNMYIYSTVDAFTSVPIAPSITDVKFSADGSFAYVAGTPTATSISGFATCNAQSTIANPSLSPAFDFVTTPGIPLQIFISPDAQHVLALDPPNVDIFSTVDNQIPLPDGQFVCNGQAPIVNIAPTVNFPQTVQSFNLGQGNFAPIYAQLVADGSEIIVVAQNIPAVLLFNVSNGTTTSVPLVNNASPLSAAASTDGTQVFVAACDQYDQSTMPPTCAVGSVHIVNTISQGDFQQVPYVNVGNNGDHNMCNNGGNPVPQCLPNLVALRPQ
jgi:hypothetical protein